jgi:hypothetical protein
MDIDEKKGFQINILADAIGLQKIFKYSNG